jgi:hypothetical protein
MENNLGRKTVTPSLLTPIAKVNSSLPISYEFPLLSPTQTHVSGFEAARPQQGH